MMEKEEENFLGDIDDIKNDIEKKKDIERKIEKEKSMQTANEKAEKGKIGKAIYLEEKKIKELTKLSLPDINVTNMERRAG